MKLNLHVSDGKCMPCSYLRKFIKDNNIKDVNIVEGNGGHPLVYDYPTLIINNASVIKGVTSIQRFLESNKG